ncbi:MAG: VCBS repeat-containing protein [Thermoanaerobaculia bacterium]|jgi:hypothetical protein
MIENRVVLKMMTAVIAGVFALVSAGCASAPKQAAAKPAAVPATSESKPAEPSKPEEKNPNAMNPMAGEDLAASWLGYQPLPPDGVWLVDTEGREYFVQPIAKEDGRYLRTGPNMVRVPPGIPLMLEREDDDYFYVKVFKLEKETGLVPASSKKLTAEEKEAIAKTYELSIPTSHELSFTAIGEGLPVRDQWRNGFALADVDGDGALDLIHGPARRTMGGKPVIFRGDGKGGFSRWQGVSWPAYPYDYGDAAAGDFNGDGKIDLAFAIHLRGIVAMLGDGKGKFTPFSDGLDLSDPTVQNWSKTPFTSRALEVVDWNKDGRDDILAVSEGPARTGGGAATAYTPGKRIYLAEPNGWKVAAGSPAADSTIGDTVALGDFNADGRTDFITGVSRAGGKTLINTAGAGNSWNVSTIESLRPGAIVRGVAAADLNGDKRDDIFVGWLNTEAGVSHVGVDLMLSQPGGWARIGLWGREGRQGVRALAVGDLDGDGKTDLVGFADDSQPVILKGHGQGKFTLESAEGINQKVDECAGYSVALADLDRDGKDEIVAGFAGERCATQGSLRAWKAAPSGKK